MYLVVEVKSLLTFWFVDNDVAASLDPAILARAIDQHKKIRALNQLRTRQLREVFEWRVVVVDESKMRECRSCTGARRLTVIIAAWIADDGQSRLKGRWRSSSRAASSPHAKTLLVLQDKVHGA